MYRLVVNKIRCKWCGDIIESLSRHDFVQCRCKKCAVDGGHDYASRAYSGENPDDIYEDLSQYYDPETERLLTAKEAAEKDIPTEPQEEIQPNYEELDGASLMLVQDVHRPRILPETTAFAPKMPTRGRYKFSSGETIVEYFD